MRIAVLSKAAKCYSTLRIVEEITHRGHKACVLNYSKCTCVVENGKSKVLLDDDVLENIDAIIPRIGSSHTNYGAAIIRQFESLKVFSTLSSIALVRSRDKLRSLQILAKHGVDIPKTAYANNPNGVRNLVKKMGGAPLIIKVLEGTQGTGVMLAESDRTAISIIQAFQNVEHDIIVQQFITEAKGNDIRAFVINGSVVGAILRKGAEGEFRSNLHQGGSAHIIELDECEKKLAVNAAAALGLNIAGVDIIQSNSGPKVIEVNSSPGLEGIEKATGINIAGKIIEYIETDVSVSEKCLM